MRCVLQTSEARQDGWLRTAQIFARGVAPGRAPLTADLGCDVGLDDHSVAQPFLGLDH
jgi:hypothetical protein